MHFVRNLFFWKKLEDKDISHIPHILYFIFDFSIFDLKLANFGSYLFNMTAKFANLSEKTINSKLKQTMCGMWDQ